MHPPPLPQYVMLNGQGNNGGRLPAPPPYHRNIPTYNHHHKKRSQNCCFRCLCCCYCLLLLLILIVAGTLLYVFLVVDPQPPSYKIKNFEVKDFNVQPDFSLKTLFLVTVISKNPNKDIGMIYEKHSSVVVLYDGSSICSGKLPYFHQKPLNTSTIHIELKGKSEFGSGLQEAYSDSKKQGKIPLLVVVKAPVVIVINGLRTDVFLVNVNCSLVVDSLSPHKNVKILSSSYTYGTSFH